MKASLAAVVTGTLVAGAVLSAPLVAQAADSGTISGVVTDSTGAFVEVGGAHIIAHQVVGTGSQDDSLEIYSSENVSENGAIPSFTLPEGDYYFEFLYNRFIGSQSGQVTGAIGSAESSLTAFPSLRQAFIEGEPVSVVAGEPLDLSYQFAATSTILGTTVDSNGDTVANQSVSLYQRLTSPVAGEFWEVLDSTTTDEAGGFYFPATLDHGVPAGTYAVQAGSEPYSPVFWSDEFTTGVADVEDATAFTIGANDHSTELIFSLEGGEAPGIGSISGKVRTASGTALAGAQVAAYDYWTQEFAGESVATTDSSGNYTLSNLPEGDYLVEFSGPTVGTTRYFTEYYFDTVWEEDAEAVSVYADEVTTNINASLAKSGTISGLISLAGATLDADTVSVTACETHFEEEWTECGLGTATVAENGAYVIGNLEPGTYTVSADYYGSGNFRDEFFPNAETGEEATHFALVGTGAVTGKNIQLDPGVTISGNVARDGMFGAPLSGVEVSAHSSDEYSTPWENDFESSSYTNDDGDYTIGGLWPGDYFAFAHDITVSEGDESTTYAGEWAVDTYSPREAASYAPDFGSPITSVNFSLAPGSSLSGKLVDAENGAAIDGVEVSLSKFLSADNNKVDYIDYIESDEDGLFSFSGLPAGDYLIEAGNWGTDTYLRSYYGAEPGEGVRFATRMTVDGTVSDLSVPLKHSGTYVGTIENAAGDPLEGVLVTLGDEFEDNYSYTDENGEFELPGLSGNDVELLIDPSEADLPVNYAAQTITGPPVQLSSEPTSVGTVVLAQAAVLKGIVRAASGTPVPGAYLAAYTRAANGSLEVLDWATSNAKGEYSFPALPVGSVYVNIESSKFPAQFAGGSPEISVATPFVLESAGSVLYRDITLYAGASISGIVTDKKTGNPLKGVEVFAYRVGLDGGPDFFSFSAGVTSSTGSYVLPGLSAGTHFVFFGSPGGFNKYGNTYDEVHVSEKQALKKNKTLTASARVSGTIRDSNGSPIGDVDIIAINAQGEEVAYGFSLAGEYSFYLPAGSYTLLAMEGQGRGKDTYLGGVDTFDDATFFTMGATALGGKNITLVSGEASITANVVGGIGDDTYGYITLQHFEGDEVVWTKTFSTSDESDDIESLFPVKHLDLGAYSYELIAQDRDASFQASGEFVLTESGLTDLGTITLDEGVEHSDSQVINSGDAPSLSDDSPTVGSTLVADPGDWTNRGEVVPAEDLWVQWVRDGKIIPAANGLTYTVKPGDAGKKLSFVVYPDMFWAIDFGFGNAGVASETTNPVTSGAAAELVVAPVVTGTGQVGQKLTVSSGEWSLAGATISYQWKRAVEGLANKVVSASSTYVPVAADLGATTHLFPVVTVKKPGFETRVLELEPVSITPAIALVQSTKSTISKAGAQLTISKGTFTPAATSFSYVWTVHETDGSTHVIESCATNICTPDVADQGDYISVVITGKRTGYTSKSVTYIAQLGQKVTLTTPVVGGANKVGRPLTVDTSAVVVDPAAGATNFTYQWKRNGVSITGATKSTFTPTLVGGTLTVAVIAKKTGYVPSDAVTVIVDGTTAAAGGTIDADLAIVGNALVGRTVKLGVTGAWSPTPTTITYQWYRYSPTALDNRVAITGATTSSYAVKAADVTGGSLTLIVKAKRTGYTSATFILTSTEVETRAVTNVTAPSIAATAKVGTPVTAKVGTWDVAPTSYAYQWFVNERPIGGATAATYTPSVDDVNEQLSVTVVAKRSGIASSVAVSSNVVTVEKGAAPVATVAPSVTVGGVVVTSTTRGKTLAASSGSWSKGGTELAYQWQILVGTTWTNIADETSRTLVTTGFATGKYRVVVTASGAGVETSAPKASNVVVLK